MKSSRVQTTSDGFVALMTVLIIGSISLAIALWLLVAGTDSQRWNLVQQHAADARQTANTCAEEALQQINDSTSYNGSEVMNFGSVSCTYTVINTGPTTKEIDVTTSGLKTTSKLKVYVTINASTISVTSWQEIT